MSYGPNRWGKHPKTTAIKAGGVKMFFRHPMLAGHVFTGTNIDEIDVSRACKLNDTFFDASPSLDSAYQEVLVDGSVITITNTLLAGTLSLQILEQGGFVGRGDLIAALQLIQSTGDSVGGTFTIVRQFDGITRVRVYYGVFVKHVPHERIAGNSVVVYPVQLYYAGWFDGVGAGDAVSKDYIWAVGNSRGTQGNYTPFAENQNDTTEPGGLPANVYLHTDTTEGSVDDLTAFGNIPGDPVDFPDVSGTPVPMSYPNGVDLEYVQPPDPSATPQRNY